MHGEAEAGAVERLPWGPVGVGAPPGTWVTCCPLPASFHALEGLSSFSKSFYLFALYSSECKIENEIRICKRFKLKTFLSKYEAALSDFSDPLIIR